MKVLHINCNYMDSWLHQTMVSILQKKYIENDVFVPLYSLDNHIVKPNDYVCAKVCFNRWDRVLYHYKQKKILKAIDKEYNFEEFSLIHAYTTFTDGNVARTLSGKYNIPYVVAVRNTDVNAFFKYMPHLRMTGIKVMLDAKYVFFLSKAYKDLVLSKYVPEKYKQVIAEKSLIIPNGIDDFWHNNQFLDKNIESRFSRIGNKCLRLVYAGAIDANKNLITTCEAIDVLRSRGYKIDFTVAGKVVDNKVYEIVKPYMNYKGILKKEQLIDIYRDADIFVMPSHTESFGLVYAEAMSQGLPVIYTKGQGFDGHFEDGTVGKSVDSHSAKEVADAIEYIADNYKRIRSMVMNASEQFLWDDICDRYIELYNR